MIEIEEEVGVATLILSIVLAGTPELGVDVSVTVATTTSGTATGQLLVCVNDSEFFCTIWRILYR